jgi:hypothetical protein
MGPQGRSDTDRSSARRTLRWIAVVLIASALVAGTWWLPAKAPPATTPHADAGVVEPGWQQALLDLADPEAAPPAPPLAQGEAQLCDYGRVQLDPAGGLPASLVGDARRAWQRVADRLIARDDAAERARGYYMNLHAAERRAVEQRIASIPGCAEDDACRNRVDGTRGAGDEWTVELARLAAGARDAHAYALALYACKDHVGELAPPACAGISAARWAQLDPDNAMPWLYAAAEAEARRDFALRDETLQRLARSRHSNPQWDGWFDLTLAGAVLEQPRSAQAALLDELAGLNFSMPVPPYQLLLQFCSRERVTDAGRRQTCSEIAELLVHADGSLLAHRVGTALGARAGWSADRIATLNDEFEATRLTVAKLTLAPDRYSCDAQAALGDWFRDVSARGELGAARLRIEASGRSVAELAQEGRETSGRAGRPALGTRSVARSVAAADAVPVGPR